MIILTNCLIGQPTFICLQKDNEMECYLQKELGWDPFVGYKVNFYLLLNLILKDINKN